MSTKTTIATSSTNIASRATTTTATILPPSVMRLPRDQRTVTASKIVLESNRLLEDVQDQLPNVVDPILEGEQESTFIRDGSVVNIFNISGPNAQVYISSQDHSINVANITPKEVFEEFRKIIAANIQKDSERSELFLKVEELEQSRGTTQFVQKYSEFMALAANHLELFTSILPALTQWLAG